MPGCNIVGCGATKRKNQTNLTFHRLPRNEVKKKKWLDIIGIKNIRPKTKEIFICSLHFEDNAFNRTLEIVKLRDDALPSRHLLCLKDLMFCVIFSRQRLSKMVQRCIMHGCESVWYPGTHLKFHKFPKHISQRESWISILPIKTKFYETARICNKHFKESDYDCKTKRLKQTAVPLFISDESTLPGEPRNKSSAPPSVDEHEVTSSSSRHNASNSIAVESMPKNNTENLVTSGHPKYSDTSVFNESGGEVENQCYDAPMGSSSETESAMSFSSTTSQRDSTNIEIIKNQQLKKICRKQRNEIKRLKEIVRKQRRKIATFTNILKILTKQRS